MKLLEQLYHWRNILLRQAREPAFIPLTREELTVLVSDCGPYTRTERFIVDGPPKLFGGIDVFDSPFGAEMRQRQIELSFIKIAETVNIAPGSWCSEAIESFVQRRLTARICHDTTEIKLTFEWDILAKFKRKFRLTKWFPVRTAPSQLKAGCYTLT